MEKLFFILVILFNFNSICYATGDADLRAIDKVSRRLDELNKSKSQCKDCTEQGQYSCFDFLEKMRVDELTKMVTVQGSTYKCQSSTSNPGTKNKFSNVSDLQNHFSKMYPELGPVNHNQIKSCGTNVDEVDEVSRYKVSKFYYYMKKFNEGATRAVEEISSINNLLSSTTPMECIGKGTLPQAFNRCQELNEKCKAKSRGRGEQTQLQQLAQESEADEKLYLANKKDIETIDSQCLANAKDYDISAKDVTEKSPSKTNCEKRLVNKTFENFCTKYTWDEKQRINKCKQVKEKLQVAVPALEDRNPWFRNESYFKSRKTKSVAESIKEYKLNIKKELEKKINEFQDAGLCMNGFKSSKDCDINKVRKLLAATPDIPKVDKKDPKNIAASIYLNVNDCVEIKNEFNAETVKDLKGAARDVTLILATAGASGYYMAAKAAQMAGRSANAGAALIALSAGNAVFASQSYDEVSKSCGETDQKIEIAMNAEGKGCPGPRSPLSEALSEHTNCFIAKSMFAIDIATLGFPLLSMGMKSAYEAKVGKAFIEDFKKAANQRGLVKSVEAVPNSSLIRDTEEIKTAFKDVLGDVDNSEEIVSLISKARAKGIPDKKIKEALTLKCLK
jgi:hypothetical protein